MAAVEGLGVRLADGREVPCFGLTGPFAILEFPERTDSDVAYTESLGGMIYLEKDREVRSCAEAFDRMRAAALSPAASVELIQRVLHQSG